MKAVKERELVVGQRVQVYYNLHQGGYSIKDKKTGLVVAYADNVLLRNCIFKVQQAGRRKTIEERRKRVHAFVEGDFESADTEHDHTFMNRVYYNPYLTEEFTDSLDGRHVFQRDTAYLIDKVCYTD